MILPFGGAFSFSNSVLVISSQFAVEKRFKTANDSLNMGALVDNALVCHLCDLGSNRGQGMCQRSGRRSRFGGFPRVLRFPPPRLTT